MSRLDEIRARLEAATPGPWHLTGEGIVWTSCAERPDAEVCDPERYEDSEFIAWSPGDIAFLLARVDALTDALRACMFALSEAVPDANAREELYSPDHPVRAQLIEARRVLGEAS